jgi:hypothetical protein
MPCKTKITNLAEIQEITKHIEEDKKSLIEKSEQLTPGFAEIMELANISFVQNKLSKTQPTSDNLSYLILQVTGKSTIGLSPVSQINFLDPIRKSHIKSNTLFNSILTNKDIIGSSDNLLISMNCELKEGEVLYIPSYFFRQFKFNSEDSRQLVYEFNSNSKVLDSFFKVLFDDDNTNSEI